MKCRILRWLLGIWLVETVAARHIQNGEDTGSTRNGRDQFHPFYPQQSSHSSYNTFRSSMRVQPPQVPGRRNFEESDSPNGGNFYNYFAAEQPSPNAQNLYSAVRLHGALETRARNEPGSNTFSASVYQPAQHETRKVPQRSWRRDDNDDDSRIDGDSYERTDDLARFSLYNSYFDNEHSIKALNSMKCVTPTGSAGFCSTFKGCVPSFFTTTGELEAPALAELISTSIGYCTTNQSHHFIREQKQLAGTGSREDRRFDSVANRIICCPGVAPVRDPNEDPDKIFNDYIENQKKKSTSTTTTTEAAQPEEVHDAVNESGDNPSNEPEPASPQVPVVSPEENIVSDTEAQNQDGSQNVPEAQNTVEVTTAQIPTSSSMYPVDNQSGSSSMYPDQSLPNQPASMNPEQAQSSEPSSMYPEQTQPNEQGSHDQSVSQSDSSSMYPEHSQTSEPSSMYPVENQTGGPSMYPEQSQQTESTSNDAVESHPGSSSMYPEHSQTSEPASMYPVDAQTGSSTSEQSVTTDSSNAQQQDQSQTSEGSMYPMENVPAGGISMYPDNTVEHHPTTVQPETVQSGIASLNPEHTEPGSGSGPLDESKPSESMNYPEDNSIGQQHDEQSLPSSSMVYPESTIASVTQPIVEESSQGSVHQDETRQTTSAPHAEESVTQEVSSAAPVNDQPETPSEVSSAPPGTEQPSPGGAAPEETVVGSKPIIIVTNPSEMFPNFPSDFPPIGSQEVMPVDDSSLELQNRPRPVLPVSDEVPSNDAPASMYPSSTSTTIAPEVPQTTVAEALNDEQVPSEPHTSDSMTYPSGQEEVTTGSPQQDENRETTVNSVPSQGLQDENNQDLTTLPPPQLVTQENGAIGESSVVQTTRMPLQDDNEDDALTIIPINPSSSTTETSVSAATAVESSSQSSAGQEQVENASPAEGQDVDATTAAPAASSQEIGLLEATTSAPEDVQLQQVSTALPESDESEESQEVGNVTNRPAEEEQADIVKTTSAPAVIPDAGVPTALPAADENTNAGVGGSFDDESLPASTIASVQQDQPVDADLTGMVYPPSNEGEMQYSTSQAPAVTTVTPNENESPSKVMLSPGSEGDSQNIEPSGSQPGAVPVKNDDDAQDGESVSETVQPFPATSPASTGEAGGSEQQQFPVESSNDQPQTTVPPSDIYDQPPSSTVGGPGASSDSELPAVSSSVSENHDTSAPSSEQSSTTNEASTSQEVTSPTNVGNDAGLPTTSAPINSGNEQDNVISSDAISGGDSSNVPSSEHSTPDGTSSDDSSSLLPVGGSEPIATTSQPAGISGDEPVSGGSESPNSGNESSGSGTESTNGGNVSSTSGDSSQNDDPSNAGSESGSVESIVGSTESAPTQSSQPPVASTEAGEFSPAELPAEGSNQEAASTEQPALLPSNDESSADHSNDAFNESSVPSSTVQPATTGGPVEAESISQDNVPSVSSDAPEGASPMQELSTQPNTPVSTDNLQDSQSSISTTEVPQDVSSPVSIETTSTMSAMYQSSTEASTEPSLNPADITPNYQILKACKFQNFFRSVNDQTYSYRHYPWLATIVGGTRPFSSGTLITDRHILTASHFLANITVSDVFNMRIHVGYRTSYSGQTEGPYAVRKVRKVIRHKGFSFEKLYNDVAVLVLDRPVRFSEDIYPVCISSNRTAYADGTSEAFETGWVEDPRTYTISQHHNYVDPHIQKYFSFGYKNITWRLQEASQRVRTNQECQSNYSFLEKNGILVTDSMVCAGSGDTRSCGFRGNSGAPLFLRNENDRMTEQIGIVSFGIGCGHFPFVFTRVESFLPWLDRVVYNSR